MIPNSTPIPLGTFVMPFGKVAAVGVTGGERYYWMVSHDGDVAMMPWFIVEKPPTVQPSDSHETESLCSKCGKVHKDAPAGCDADCW